MDEKLNYRIGLDIGIASVGWAVLENNSQDEPVHIVDLGVRIFDKAEQPKTGEALAAPRRDARSARRRLRRRKHRLDRIKWLLQENRIIEIDRFMDRYHKDNLPDVYELRCKALKRKLTNDELAQVLIHIAKHRGFKSNRKSELASKENGAVLTAVSENEKRMEEKGYRTVGEMIYKDEAFHTQCLWSEKGYVLSPRNKAENYQHTMLRSMLEDEVKTIFQCQRELGNTAATKDLEGKYLEIMLSQRSFDMGPGKQPDGTPSPYALDGFGDRVGKCTLEPEEQRAAKATYTAELFVALQKVNHIRFVDRNGVVRELSKEEREIVIEILHTKKDVKYIDVRKKLGIDVTYKFNTLNYSTKDKEKSEEDKVKETEKVKFAGMPNYYEYQKRIGHFKDEMSEEDWHNLLDEIGTILTLYKNDDTRTEKLMDLGVTQQEDIDSLLELSPSKFQHVSLKAMKKVMPYLMEGLTYDKACDEAGYDFKGDNHGQKNKLLKGEDISTIINEITNPVVKRSVSQTVKVINAIIQKYGSPQAINIELAREMAKNFNDRRELEKKMDDRFKDNDTIKKRIQELGIISPTGMDIIKYRLWNDQGGICMYSGKVIPLESLFARDSGYDVDHILPYSITFDDSYRNKVLVTAAENRQKGNRTPYEYFGQDEERWREYEARVTSTIRDYKKQQKLLKKNFTEEERKQFKERNLTDTKYITKVVYNMIRNYLEFEPYSNPDKKKQVRAVNGVITSYLRKRWGLPQKNRETDTHHAMDAVVIACVTDGMIHKITRYSQGRELKYARGFQLIDMETGEIFERDKFSQEEWEKKFGVQISRPWNEFKNEVVIRMSYDPVAKDPKAFLDAKRDVAVKIDYPEYIYKNIHPIFVSRMPNHKVTGQAHAETIRSPRHYKDQGIVLSKTALQDLKLNAKTGEIENYYNPDSDCLLYSAIKRQLQMYGNDGKKAFAEDFHKPKADGSEGPVVRKVKTFKKQTAGVYTRDEMGIAENGAMVRIDVFCENGKYYFVPIYTADVVKKVLPNKAATAHKPYEEWREMDDNNFIFSLYSRDLIHIKSKKGVPLSLAEGGVIKENEIYSYYIKSNIATASIEGIAHDRNFRYESLGIQSLEVFEKCQVDILGNISVVKKEKRMQFN